MGVAGSNRVGITTSITFFLDMIDNVVDQKSLKRQRNMPFIFQ
ncbi:hypothetical protein B4064_2029 [Caldibacillus thermoamylovorans]|uniref:Uncharacterized protein n=1 Tax=Caldibacillus thermoamylovorans TaxID=35841 RepID=A0A0D0EGG8_9BACI|nr:hypothetical protein B4065_1016 [Caldibacillus thermoamylovorans]KIO66518.1 hypothetical protein B4166_2483 [Caldibacillus thermoamylovorans]KIO66980.1 hypothetical protein B4064_2029 [Caldibacillus thermoamylovorans]KIO73059.1 hypothetical protein B4167_2409 [Caldibacillus thermoamylovorans]